jgi:uncharacterized protein YdaL
MLRRGVTVIIALLLVTTAAARASRPVAGPAPATIQSAAPGAGPGLRTLVLYDTTGEFGWTGEMNAVRIGHLVSHGSTWVMHPVSRYTTGEMAGYTAVVYVGSSHQEPLPAAFLDDVLSGTRPVLWMYDNIWRLTAHAGNFPAGHGWDPIAYETAAVNAVEYRGAVLRRDPAIASSGVVHTKIADPTRAEVLAKAVRADGTTFPWAVRSGSLTYLGELPLSYVGYADRYLALADILLKLVHPHAADRKRALVRIEDVGPTTDPQYVRAIADYLNGRHVPFSVAVFPVYLDPRGVHNGGRPLRRELAQTPQLVAALRYAQSRGGTLVMHGYTHQYENASNPYDAVSGNDFEFYAVRVDGRNQLVYDGPVAEDSATWARGRVQSARLAFADAGFAAPTIFEPPHYAASAVDYQVFDTEFGIRYDRGLYFGGWCADGGCGQHTPDHTKAYGQYFPYLVRDVYGSVVIPEGLGNVELQRPPGRSAADILAAARASLVVTDATASFFYHPFLGLDQLRQVVEGIQAMGYRFVSPAEAAGEPE